MNKEEILEKEECCGCHECHCHEKKEKKVNKKEKELIELEQKLAEMTDKCARAQAEMINFKRRKEEETSLRLKYCNEDILLNLVNVVDNFERALQGNIKEEIASYLQGFKMIHSSMKEILKANEVVEIDVLDKPFDPKTSEAILVEHHDDKESGSVVEVLQKGYMYKDKILRPAMVKIND